MMRPARGFVFAASFARDGEVASASPGQEIRNETAGPPWIVVAHALASVLGAGWPGRLWEVEVLEAAADQPREGAGYTRAVAVKVLREVPVSVLFGERGEDVLRVIDRAASVTADEATALAARTTEAAGGAYSRAWNAWLARVEPASVHRGGDHADTLAVFAGGLRSPIGIGPTVLHDVLARRARDVAGGAAYEVDDEGEKHLTGPWAGALAALLHAAMALGAPELVSDADRRMLLDAWEHGFGG